MTAATPSVPEALRPWQDIFSRMPEEHLRVLARLMADVRPLVEEPEQAVPNLRGELDSYDGIANRGGMERLLSGEWLWRDLDEGEFLRRFAEGELLYHRIRHRMPAESRAIGVLLDSGPWMLGRPRLVALAALLCLGRRAQRDGIPFFWRSNSLAEPGTWHEGFRLETVRRYLTEVSATDLSLAEVNRLMAAPPSAGDGKRGGPPVMRWYLIGPRAHDLSAAPGVAMQIVITENPRLDPDGAFVVDAETSLTAPSGRRRDATIPYPSEAAATALLRNPFATLEPPQPSPQAADRAAGAQDWALRHVAVLAQAKLILVRRPAGILAIDGSDPASRSTFLPIRPYETLVGVGADRRGLILARLLRYSGYGRLVVERYPNQGATETLFELGLPKDEPLCRDAHGIDALPLLTARGRRRIFWLCAGNAEAREFSAGGVRRSRMLRDGRIIQCGSDGVILRRRNGGLLARPLRRSAAIATFATALPLPEGLAAEDIRYNPRDCLMSVRLQDQWRTFRQQSSVEPLMATGPDQGTFLYALKGNPAEDHVSHAVACGGEVQLINQQGEIEHGFAAGDFRFDLVVQHEGGPHPVFAELAGQPFVTRLLQLEDDGSPRMIVIEAQMNAARWLRD